MKRTSLTAAVVAALAMCLTIASVAYGAPIKKLYQVNITPAFAPVTAGQDETFNLAIKNKSVTQTLGSCNVTLPPAVTLVSATDPSPAPGNTTVAGNVIQIRNLSAAPMATKSLTFTASSSQGTHTATVECRQANNYAPSTTSNAFTLDAASSTLSWTAFAPVPDADLSIATTEETPDPVIGGNTVKYILTVTNNGPNPSGATVAVTDTVSGAGNMTSITGAGWTCSTSGNTRTCTHGQLTIGGTATLDVRVLANVVSSPSSMTNSATVSQSNDKNDNVPGNNGTAATTTINVGNNSGSGYIDNVTGGVVMSEPYATSANKSVILVAVPGQEGATAGGYIYNVAKTEETCGLLPCNFAWFIDDILPAYDNPATEGVRVTFKCDVTVCPGFGTAVTMLVRDETGNQKVALGCSFVGFVDPNPCVESSQRLTGGEDQGDLRVTMLFLAGDPKVAGLCVGAC